MKFKNLFTYIALFSLLSISYAYSQSNTVELQDGGGTFISSHSSVEEAYNAIPAAISQAYIIEILSGYNGSSELFPIDLALKTGHSASNTITIRPDAGNTGEIISSSNSAGIIILNDADYIIIDGRPGGVGTVPDLEIRNTVTSGTNANTISMINGATHCIIRYVKSYNATAGSTGPKNISFKTSLSNPTGNSDNLVEECLVSGGRTGVCSEGTTANPNFNNVVRNNTIIDWGFNGIWFLNASAGMTVEGNTIYNTTGVSITNPSGINIQSTYDGYNLIIRNNKITNVISTNTTTSLNVRGINTVTAPGTGSNIEIYNNFIALNSDNNNCASTFGIYSTGTTESHTISIYNNSIIVGGTQTGGIAGNVVSACIVKQSTVAGVVYNQRNNVCVNNRTGGTSGVLHLGCAINGTEGTLNIDYNSYHASGSSEGANSYPASWDSTEYDDITAYIGVSGETNVRFKNTNFVSSTDLHITGASLGDPDLSARPIAGITTDIDGDTRNADFPYRGADEAGVPFTIQTLNLTVNLEACSPVQDTVKVQLRNVTSPYSIVEVSQKYLSGTGTASLSYAKAVDGVSYYLVVRHRNSIQTWSKSGGESFTSGTLSYDFTTAASQAYGNNQVLVGGEYSVYTADVDQNDIVDGSDGSLIDNDAAAFATGYIASDLNYDEIVDGTDALFAENNAANFVSAAMP